MPGAGSIVDMDERNNFGGAMEGEKFESGQYFENLPIPAYNIDLDGKIIDCNNVAVEMLGYTGRDELIGRPLISTVYAASSREKAGRLIEKWKKEGKLRNEELQIITKHGEIKDILLNADTIFDPSGNPLHSLSTHLEITDRRRAEEALRESEERYRILAENASDVIWIRDMNLKLTYISPSVEKLRGFTVEEAMAQTIDENMTAASAEISRKALIEGLTMECQDKRDLSQSKTIEVEMKCKDDSTVWVEVKMSLLRDREDQPVGILGISRDITKRKRTEKALRKSEEQLHLAQRLESVGRLAGGVAHDFNNILQVISGYTEMLIEEFSLGDPRRSDLEEIKKSTMRAASLTRQLLAYSRKQRLRSEVKDLNALVTNMDKMLRRLIGEDIALVTDLAPELERVKIDSGQTEQVIMNLAVNARDAMPLGGSLTIMTENAIVDEDYCREFPYARPGKFVCMSVDDFGIGMDESIVDRIFEPFFTTKGMAEGTGLGLSVVYGIVKQHDGWINVRSEPGKGSSFKIYLPAVSESPEDEVEKKILVQELRGRGERILLVEDEKAVLEFSARLLDQNGYIVFKAKNSKEALEIFDREKGDFHLVLSDVVLPDESGLHLAEQILTRKPKLKILLCSGYTDERSQWTVIRERGFPFVQKPYKTVELLQAIKEAMEER